MIYAVSVLIIAVFAVLYLLFKPKIREEYCDRISNFDVYSRECRAFVRSMPLPKQSSVNLNENYFSTSIKSSIRKLGRMKDKNGFDMIFKLVPQIKALANSKFEDLNKLASVDGVPRIVKIADFCLSHSNFEFSEERIVSAINLQNEFRTLSFEEIIALNSAFLYVLFKRTAILMNNVATILKMKRIADKNAKHTNLIKDEKTYKELKQSKLFLSFCAENGNFDSNCLREASREYFENLAKTFENIFACKSEIDKMDFSSFYLPLQIFSKYEAFENATPEEKIAFLQLVKTLSDKENVDELLFAIRVDNYMKSASVGHKKYFGFDVLDRKYLVISAKKDVSMLASALSSDTMMRLLFGSNKNKTILKSAKFENTFAKIGKFESVNLGISISNDKLRVRPNLPKNIERLDAVIKHNGALHTLHITRGEEKALYLGTTKLTGTSIVKLGNKPTEITVAIPFDR